jgi:hypothetical protein
MKVPVLPERPRNFSQVGAAVNGGGGCYIRPEVRVPVSTSIEYVTTRHQWFTRVRLLKTHLTE